LFIFPLPFPIKAKFFVIGYAAIELWSGLANSAGDNVAHFAHLGGMLFGLILILYWRKKSNNNGLFNSLKREYIYKVELLTTTDKIVGETVGYYLHMCPKWLFKTTYPHRLAINAHYRNSVQQCPMIST
jgi:hypothetical protein